MTHCKRIPYILTFSFPFDIYVYFVSVIGF